MKLRFGFTQVAIFLILLLFQTGGQALASTSPAAGPGPLGLGVMFGEPTGVTLKYWTGSTTALNFGITYSFGNYLLLLGDCLWHFPNLLFPKKHHKLHPTWIPYLGIGIVLGFQHTPKNNTGTFTGGRIPVGVEFLLHSPPIGIFAELAPGITLAPYADGFLQGNVGARYYFK